MPTKKRRNLKKRVKEYLEMTGWVVGDVETKRGPCSLDLFGIADLLAFHAKETVLVQVTSKSNAASRRSKILDWKDRHLWKGEYRKIMLALVDKDNKIEFESC